MAKAVLWTVIFTDAEARKRGEQTGLDTLVVHAINDGSYTLGLRFQCSSKRNKLLAWGVRSQD